MRIGKRRDKEKRASISTHDLGRLPINQLLRYYAVPSIVGTMVNSLYNIVDRIFIGQGVGGLAISGLALTFPILIFLQAFGILVGVGASSRISILLGQRKSSEAEELLGNSLLLSILLSVTTITLCYIFMEPLLYAFGASEETMPYAKGYLEIVIPGNIFANLTFSYNSVMRATGYPRKAMLTMIIGAVLNVMFDALFIFGFGWGIAGAAWATVLSMFVGMIFVMQHFVDKRNLLLIKLKNLRIRKRYTIAVLSIGVAPFIMQLAASMVQMMKNSSLVHYGGDFAVGAHGISNSINTLVFMIILGLAQGMQPIVGYNYGAGLKDRVRETFEKTVKANMLVGFVGIIFTQFFTEILVRFFTSDETLVSVAKPAVRIENIAFWAVGFQVTSVHFFQSIGAAKSAMILSVSRQIAFLIPMIYLLPLFWQLTGVWLATPVADLLAFAVSLFMIYRFFRRFKDRAMV